MDSLLTQKSKDHVDRLTLATQGCLPGDWGLKADSQLLSTLANIISSNNHIL